jgi:hypothetical protein
VTRDPAEVERVKARLGRPPQHAPLYGLDAAALAAIVDGRATAGTVRQARRYLAGQTDMGTRRLYRLLAALPGVDAREVVAELARRLGERRVPHGAPETAREG